jgi:hypothetical protein
MSFYLSQGPIFDFNIDDASSSLTTALQCAKEYFLKILQEDSIPLPEGKLTTHSKGSMLLRVYSSEMSEPNPVYAIFRTNDLYLDSVVSQRKCFRFNDCDKDLALPNELFDKIVDLDFESNYKSLNCSPKKQGQISIAVEECHKHYEVLVELENSLKKDTMAVKRALVCLMALFSESLRFIDLEKWVSEILTSGIKLHIPLKFTALFNKWGNMSTILHKGRAAYEAGAGAIHDDKITDEEIIKQWSSYDSICSILGVVNKVNLNKVQKTKAKRKAKSFPSASSSAKRMKHC